MKEQAQLLASLIALAAAALNAGAVSWTGGGADGKWSTAANWDSGRVPESAEDVIVTNGAVEYVAGQDLRIGSGCTLTIGRGGSFVQSGEDSWIRVDGNVVLLDGGVFDSGTAGEIHMSGSFTINKGSSLLRREKNLKPTVFWVFNGGTVDIGMAEFQFGSEIDFNGILYAGKLAAQSGEAVLNFTGGHIYLRNSDTESFFQPGAACLNFPARSTGVVTLTNCTADVVYSRYFDGATPKMKYQGAPVSSVDFPNTFAVQNSIAMENAVDILLDVKTSKAPVVFQAKPILLDATPSTGSTADGAAGEIRRELKSRMLKESLGDSGPK